MQIPGYRIIRKINQGGMSTVYLAVQLSVGREVALKVMSPVLNADPVFGRRFQREANIVGQLSHPNIVSIYDIGCHNGLNYIAMDYLPGGTVHERMRKGMSSADVLRITRQIARALDVAHSKGYVHRDIKPENILFREDGAAVLTDFGVARTVSSAARVTNAGTVVGTPHYMSPEQSRGQPIDGRADLYSLGIVFYEMLTGVVPYQAEEAVAIAIKHLTAPIPTLPGHYAIFQPLLNRLLAKEVEDRFQRGAEIADAIAAIEETLAGHAGRRTPLTDAAEMNVMVLLKALLLTSAAALRAKAVQIGLAIGRLRWSRARGFYRRPDSDSFGDNTVGEHRTEQRTTIVSTAIRNAVRNQSGRSRILQPLGALAGAVGLWTLASLLIVRFELAGEDKLPHALQRAFAATANLVYDEEAAGEDLHSPEFLPGEPATARAEEPENPASRETLEPAPPSFYALTVIPDPGDARVRVLNIRERYKDGIRLTPGSYHIEVSKPGFATIKRWVELTNRDLQLSYQLSRVYRPGETLVDNLTDGGRGPELVVLGPGEFVVGKNGEHNASPERTVRIAKPLAISKHEITFADYNLFVTATGAQPPYDEGWGGENRPLINVTWHEAAAYALWLSKQSGAFYRLPTEAEWEYAARAGSTSNYWWGDDEPAGRANCKKGCDSEYTGFFSSKTAPVGRFPANPFGLHDTAGNVAEWVLDCYQDHYRDAPRDGRAVTTRECRSRPVRGGSARDDFEKLYSYSREAHDPEDRSAMIGFRLVRELEN